VTLELIRIFFFYNGILQYFSCTYTTTFNEKCENQGVFSSEGALFINETV